MNKQQELVEGALDRIFDAIDFCEGDAMRQRQIREALNDLYIAAQVHA